jgi:uncharacterized membrane protein YkvA (DUF1232 family)
MFNKFKKNGKKRLSNDEEELKIPESEVEELKIEAEEMDESTIHKHEKHFSDNKFWEKIKKFSKKAGSTVVYAVLLLYFTMQKKEIPLKVKATIAGALGYFILPFDLIPDVAVGVGFTDDLGVLSVALFQVAMYIDEDIKIQAKNKLKDWFGDEVDTSEIDDKL